MAARRISRRDEDLFASSRKERSYVLSHFVCTHPRLGRGFLSDRRQRQDPSGIRAAVVFTLGRFQKVKGPGLVLLIPFVQEMVRVDLRIQVIEIPSQDVISRDNVSMKVDAVLYFSVVNSERAIIKVQSYFPATNMLAQTTLRSVLGQHDLDEMLSERKKLSTDVQSILDAQTEIWGIKVSNVEIRTVELTENMVRAIAKQAEAERDRRAKIIHAEAEFQASQTLVNAAQILASIPAAMQLRYLQTLTEIGAEQNSTIVFPMPIDIIKPFLESGVGPAGYDRQHRRAAPPPPLRVAWLRLVRRPERKSDALRTDQGESAFRTNQHIQSTLRDLAPQQLRLGGIWRLAKSPPSREGGEQGVSQFRSFAGSDGARYAPPRRRGLTSPIGTARTTCSGSHDMTAPD